MIKCPNPDCGYENVDGTQFCEGCGEELPQAAGATPAAPAAAGANMIKCPACDNLNLPDNVVCEVCGTELKPGAAAAAPSPASSAPPTASGAAVGGGTQAGGGTVAPPASVSFPNAGSPAVAAATPDATPVPATISGAPSAPLDVAVPGLSDTTGAGAGTVVAAGSTTSGVTPDPGMAAATASAADASAGMGGTVVAPDVTGVAPSMAPLGTDTSIGSPAMAGTPAGTPIAAASPMATATGAPTITGDPAAGTSVTGTSVGGTSLGAVPTAGGALQPGAVKLTVEQGMAIGKQFVLGDPELLVGREDEEESIYPDIDLSDQDEGYVHRRHATMRFENGQLMVTHLGGVNKTRINNRPIPDDTPQPVNIGDKLSFGKVVMRVGSI
ncbi:MAG TPA: zinc ribbon domain-containing protein [Abditibacteriaceae bacterium]|jgi:hypothetical protein